MKTYEESQCDVIVLEMEREGKWHGSAGAVGNRLTEDYLKIGQKLNLPDPSPYRSHPSYQENDPVKDLGVVAEIREQEGPLGTFRIAVTRHEVPTFEDWSAYMAFGVANQFTARKYFEK
jgi:hypothetical protein